MEQVFGFFRNMSMLDMLIVWVVLFLMLPTLVTGLAVLGMCLGKLVSLFWKTSLEQ